jgi:hypothetical protein
LQKPLRQSPALYRIRLAPTRRGNRGQLSIGQPRAWRFFSQPTARGRVSNRCRHSALASERFLHQSPRDASSARRILLGQTDRPRGHIRRGKAIPRERARTFAPAVNRLEDVATRRKRASLTEDHSQPSKYSGLGAKAVHRRATTNDATNRDHGLSGADRRRSRTICHNRKDISNEMSNQSRSWKEAACRMGFQLKTNS